MHLNMAKVILKVFIVTVLFLFKFVYGMIEPNMLYKRGSGKVNWNANAQTVEGVRYLLQMKLAIAILESQLLLCSGV